jgi:hypothetical protein
VSLISDAWPGETSWAVKDVCDNNRVVLSGGPYTNANSLMTETGSLGQSTYALYVYDSYGDGLGSNTYSASMDGVTVVSGNDFSTGYWDFHTFGTDCPSNNLSLNFQGNDLGSANALSECGGDCDNDGECQVSNTCT